MEPIAEETSNVASVLVSRNYSESGNRENECGSLSAAKIQSGGDFFDGYEASMPYGTISDIHPLW